MRSAAVGAHRYDRLQRPAICINLFTESKPHCVSEKSQSSVWGAGGGEREGEGIAGTCCIWSIFLWLPGIRKMSCAVRRLATNDTRVQAHVR